MQGAQNLRSAAYSQVRRNDEGEVQRRRWTFYETINYDWLAFLLADRFRQMFIRRRHPF